MHSPNQQQNLINRVTFELEKFIYGVWMSLGTLLNRTHPQYCAVLSRGTSNMFPEKDSCGGKKPKGKHVEERGKKERQKVLVGMGRGIRMKEE